MKVILHLCLRTLLFLCPIFLIVSCKTQYASDSIVVKNGDATVIRFDVDGGGVNVPFHQSEMLDSVWYVKIDSSIVMGKIHSIKYCNGQIYLLDKQSHRIIVIDEKGKLLFYVDHRGRAKDEYLGIFKFDINSSNNQILIYDQAGDKILTYNNKGDFIRAIDLNETVLRVYRDFAVFSNGNILGCYLDYEDVEGFDETRGVVMLDSMGNYIKDMYHPDEDVKYSCVTNQHFCKIDGETIGFLPEIGNDTIYNFTKDGEICAKYIIDCGRIIDKNFLEKQGKPGDVLPDNYYDYKYYETSQYLNVAVFCSTDRPNETRKKATLIYNKQTSIPHIITSERDYVGDMKVPGIGCSSTTCVFNLFDPKLMPEEVLNLFAEELQESTNPVIQIARYIQ